MVRPSLRTMVSTLRSRKRMVSLLLHLLFDRARRCDKKEQEKCDKNPNLWPQLTNPLALEVNAPGDTEVVCKWDHLTDDPKGPGHQREGKNSVREHELREHNEDCSLYGIGGGGSNAGDQQP